MFRNLNAALGYSSQVADQAEIVVMFDEVGKVVAFLQEDGKAVLTATGATVGDALSQLEVVARIAITGV
jgi:hypothetical protein